MSTSPGNNAADRRNHLLSPVVASAQGSNITGNYWHGNTNARHGIGVQGTETGLPLPGVPPAEPSFSFGDPYMGHYGAGTYSPDAWSNSQSPSMRTFSQDHGIEQQAPTIEDSGYATGLILQPNPAKSTVESTTHLSTPNLWNEQGDLLGSEAYPFIQETDQFAFNLDHSVYNPGALELAKDLYPSRHQASLNVFPPVESSSMLRGKRPQSNLYGDSQEDSHKRRSSKRSKRSASEAIGVNQDQELTLLQSLEAWEKRDRLPNDQELKAVATLTKLKFSKVAMWYGDKLFIKSRKVNKHEVESVETFDVDPEVLRDIETYISEAGDKNCSGRPSTAAGGQFHCTLDCGFSTASKDSWERHEETRQPQQFWHCALCHESRKKGEQHRIFIHHRCDKFLPHAKSCHPLEDADELRQRSKIDYPAPFIKTCTFKLRHSSKACDQPFSSWAERNNHYVDHFKGAVLGGPWYLPGRSDSETGSDEDDDGPGTGFGNASSGWKPTKSSGPSGSDKNDRPSRGNGSQGGSYTNTRTRAGGVDSSSECRDSFSVCQDTQPRIAKEMWDIRSHRPRMWFESTACLRRVIDVEDYFVVEVSRDTRYLALRYSSDSWRTECLDECTTLPAIDQLPIILQKAIDLTKDMGFKYLWIDVYCGLDPTTETVDTIHREAGLILVIVQLEQPTNRMWHFTCAYSHLQTVQTWAQQSASFHHLQLLGHGAYSIVDKVELRPTQQTFARKIVSRMNTRRVFKAWYLQEIEIMQKFNHPHIAKFVAAYYDRDAFNIIMSPVADCDLRQFLSFPDRFPEKRPHLLQWFMSLAEALAHMHYHHCRHKDIKPANILISGSNVLLTDFGTSLDFSNALSGTTGGAFMTPKYCAPEVAATDLRGRPSDIFSLGCVFTEMITVDLGKTLDDLHSALNIEEYSSDRRATYPEQITGLVKWLHLLYSDCKNAIQRKVLNITERMLYREPQSRPDALAVTKALCSKAKCTGLRPAATCHCCPGGPSLTSSMELQSSLALKIVPSLGVFNFKRPVLQPLLYRRGWFVVIWPSSEKSQAVIVAMIIHWNMQTKATSKCPSLQVLEHAARYKQNGLDSGSSIDGDGDFCKFASKCTEPPLSSGPDRPAVTATLALAAESGCCDMEDIGDRDDGLLSKSLPGGQHDLVHKSCRKHLELESDGSSTDKEKAQSQALWTPWNGHGSFSSMESKHRFYNLLSAYVRMLST